MAHDELAPLTPANSDLRSFPYLPLDVVRLRDSDMAAVEDAEAFRAAILLWCAAWHQVPAASLPDEDGALCRLAGYGRDMKTWKKARVGGALRNWVKCSDGRLYHPVIAEKANAALDAKQAQKQRTEAARAARDAKRPQPPSGGSDKPPAENVATSVTENVTRLVTSPVAKSNRTEQKGIEERERELSSLPSSDPARASPPTAPAPVRQIGMPTLNDPPARWMAFADKTETDNDGVERPVVGGYYFDGVARDVCLAARIDGYGRALDWMALARLLRDGFDPEEHILPTIRRIAARSGYKPPRLLSYFDHAVREGRAA